MKQIVRTTLALILTAASYAGETNVVGRTFAFTISDAITFESHGTDTYSFQWVTGLNRAQLVLGTSPSPLFPEALKAQADTMEAGLEEQLKKSGHFSGIEKKRTEIEIGAFKGIELEFILKPKAGVPLRQYMFYLSDGGHGLHGQLISHHPKDRATAHAIIKSATSRAIQAGDNDTP